MAIHAIHATHAEWLLVARERLLSPRRPDLARCEAAREGYLAATRAKSEERSRAKIDCERRIEALRAEVFAAQDGVVTARMTALEREWRQISRAAERDRDGALMDLWARLVPPTPDWIDRKRWRDTAPALQLDAVIALASDADGVNKAESAIRKLLPKARIRWRLALALNDANDFDRTSELLLKMPDDDDNNTETTRIDERVHEAVLARFPNRAVLARAVAHAASAGSENAHVLRELWTTGYVISSIDDTHVTLEIPAL